MATAQVQETKPYPSSKIHRITDATEPLVFEVTENDIVGSVVGNPNNCAGACALRAQFGIVNAWVRRTTTMIEYDDGSFVRYENPNALEVAVEAFDSSAGVFPAGTYELRTPCYSHKLRTMRRYAKKNAKRERSPKSSRKRPTHALR